MMPKPQEETHSGVYSALLMAAAAIFLTLPFMMTINEFLTSVVLASKSYTLIRIYIAPIIARMVAGIFQYVLGLPVTTSGTVISVGFGSNTLIYSIAWNCIGWQSLLLYGLTAIVGLRGEYTKISKLIVGIIGFEGTILVNTMRIVLVILISMVFGGLPSTIFHEYAGTVMVLAWLAVFWYLSYHFLLREKQPASNLVSSAVLASRNGGWTERGAKRQN